MQIDFQALSGKDIYGFMIQAIVPRPIAWVLSDNGTGTCNLAPFSYFNGVSSRPPLLSISIGKKRDRSKKDTWRNIEERSHFVVHIAGVSQARSVSDTSAPLEAGDSEVTASQLALVQDADWALPRLQDAKIALLCSRYQIIEVGEGPQGLVLGEIKRAYVADDIGKQGHDGALEISPDILNPLARLGGDLYASLGEVFEVVRPE